MFIVNKNVLFLFKFIYIFVYVYIICNNFRWRVVVKIFDLRICFILYCMSLVDNLLVCFIWLFDLNVFIV